MKVVFIGGFDTIKHWLPKALLVYNSFTTFELKN